MGKLAFIDAFSGVSGDMFVAALLDAGVDAEALRAQIDALELPDVSFSVDRVRKGGIAGARFQVRCGGKNAEEHPSTEHRSLSHILSLIESARIPVKVKQTASDIFERLGRAEAMVHGVTVEKVHFHEVGGVDSIVDIVAAAAALLLLDIEEVVCSPLPLGSGTIKCAHGMLPVPGPATAELVKGIPTMEIGETGELTTPTGAAIVAAVASSFGSMPAMTIEAIGYGAGRRDGSQVPNLLRVIVGSGPTVPVQHQTDSVWLLEANLDDAPGELTGYVCDQLRNAGALDVFLTPIYMKKNRPGVIISAIVDDANCHAAEQLLFHQTTTFGVRRHRCTRSKLAREQLQVQTAWGEVAVKVGRQNGQVVTVSPEFESCRRLSEAKNISVKEVMAAAVAAYHNRSVDSCR